MATESKLNLIVAFLDTTIAIDWMVRSSVRGELLRLLDDVGYRISGLIVQQEFRRRFIADIRYLLKLVRQHGTISRILRHLNALPDVSRKRSIPMEFFAEYLEHNGEQLEPLELELVLEMLIERGWEIVREGLEFDVVRDAGCACAQTKTVHRMTKRGMEFILGPTKCSQVRRNCGIAAFLRDRTRECSLIEVALDENDSLTDELVRAREFLSARGNDPERLNPFDGR